MTRQGEQRGSRPAGCGEPCQGEAFISSYANVSKNVRLRHRDREVKAEIANAKSRPYSCGGQKTDACKPFSEEEMGVQLRKLKIRKAPGPDDICAEHLSDLGPAARGVVLTLINRSWDTALISSTWRRVTIIPIPKADKNSGSVSNYCPISLTSHLAKLAERMVALD